MKATLLFQQRIDYDDGTILEMVLWRVRSLAPPSNHGLKYPLFYAVRGFGRLVTITSAAKEIIAIFEVSRRLIPSALSSN